MLHHPPDRPHDQPLHRQKQERRSRQRYHERNEKDPPAVLDHRLPKRPFVQRHLDLALRPLVGAADDPDDPVLVGNEDPERIAHQRHLVIASQVEGLRDRRRHRPGQRQLAHVVPPQHHVQHVRRGEELGLQVRRNRHVGRGQQGERRELPHLQAVLQIIHAEPRYRRDEDQHLGDHHEEDRQAQKAPGKGIEDHADHGSRRRRTVGGAPFTYKAPSPGRSCPEILADVQRKDDVGDDSELPVHEPLNDQLVAARPGAFAAFALPPLATAFAGLRPEGRFLPLPAGFAAINARASSRLTVSGASSFGSVALTFSHLT